MNIMNEIRGCRPFPVDKDRQERCRRVLDGYGMTIDDVNNKYLHIGYRRRVTESDKTPEGRPIMGRKGLGKLSLFSIADIIEVRSFKDHHRQSFALSQSGLTGTMSIALLGKVLCADSPNLALLVPLLYAAS